MRVIRPPVQTFRAEGWSVQELLAPFQVEESDLEDVDRRVPQDVVTDLWDRARKLSGDPAFGLRALRAARNEKPSLLHYLIFNSPTLGGMIERGIRFERLWQEGREASLVQRGDTAVLRWTARPGLRFSPPLSEFAVGMVVLLARVGAASDLADENAEIRFAHPAPPDLAPYERLFGASVFFDAGEQSLTFPARLLAAPVPAADPALLEYLESHASAVLERLPATRSTAQRVRQVIANTLAHGEVSLDSVAKSLKMSARTLRRRLQDEGVTYVDVLDEVRRELSFEYLRDPKLSVTEIAYLLSFADASAFNKAFHRWTGRAPSAMRGSTGSTSR